MSGAGLIEIAFRGTVGRFVLEAAFRVPATGVTALFGPSGCGKTTVLRCIAGLHRFKDGFCTMDGDVWQDGTVFRPPHRRPIGYVFQEASLFPHLSVAGNLRFGARRRPSGPDDIAFDEVVALLGLAGLLDRAPRHLSGGERQRVAIGRALLSQPRLLLLDEPLSALDRTTRGEILPYLERLHEALALPVIYVSHEMGEVERLADTLVAMEGGRVLASGALDALLSDPSLPFALTRDAAIGLDATVESYDSTYGLATLMVDRTRFVVPGPPVEAGRRQRLRIAAGDVSLARAAPPESTILNILPVTIVSVTRAADHEMLAVLALRSDGAGARLLARVTLLSWERLALAVGQSVYAQVKSVALAPG